MGNKKSRGNGQGTFYQDKDGIWHALYFDIYGARKHIKQRKSENKTQFKDRFNETRLKAQKGIIEEKSNETINDIITEYIEYKHENNITSDRTYKRDNDTLTELQNHCEDLLNMKIIKVTANDIKKYTPVLKMYSKNTIDKQWRMITKAFKLAQSKRIIQYNPMEDEEIKKPKSEKQNKPVEALTIDEQKHLIEVIKDYNIMNDNIIRLQLFTGMRIGEVLALSRDNINLKDKTINIEKTVTRDKNDKPILGKATKTESGIRTIPITPFIEDTIKYLLNINVYNKYNLVFYNYKNDSVLCPSAINSYITRINKKYNIAEKLHTHMLRHTYATRFIEAGGSAKVLQKLLGHSKIETTLNTYASVFDTFKEDENQKYIEYMKKVI